MGLDQIIFNLKEHNEQVRARGAAAKPARKRTSKPKTPRPPQSFAIDEQLRLQAQRIVTAMQLHERGVTVEDIVEHVRRYESGMYPEVYGQVTVQ